VTSSALGSHPSAPQTLPPRNPLRPNHPSLCPRHSRCLNRPPSAPSTAHRRPCLPRPIPLENLLHLALSAPAPSHARAWKQHASPRRAFHPTTAQEPSPPSPPAQISRRPRPPISAMPTSLGQHTHRGSALCRPLRCPPPRRARPTDRRRPASGRRGWSRRQPDPVSASMPLPLHSLPNVARAASPILCMSPPSPHLRCSTSSTRAS
jgi:hypothetical protein